ncbi:hypothetical protein JNAJLEEC_00001 [Pseudomonas phage phiPA01_302]|nr:hypothetical protein JNAJLEEC_00001 [Pseudomonas phage phiPA01_302]
MGTHQVTATWGKCTFDGPWTEQGRNPKAEGIAHTPIRTLALMVAAL